MTTAICPGCGEYMTNHGTGCSYVQFELANRATPALTRAALLGAKEARACVVGHRDPMRWLNAGPLEMRADAAGVDLTSASEWTAFVLAFWTAHTAAQDGTDVALAALAAARIAIGEVES